MFDLSCEKLYTFFSLLVLNNPGTYFDLNKHDDGRFRRAFLRPSTCISAMEFALPVVIVGACHVKSKYGGMIMAPSAMDSLGRIVYIAIAVLETEDYENWSYFFGCLKSAIPAIGSPELILISERDKGIRKAQEVIFGNATPVICVWYLERNLTSRFRSKFDGKLWAAAKALKVREFEEAMDHIKKCNESAYEYLVDSNPLGWDI